MLYRGAGHFSVCITKLHTVAYVHPLDVHFDAPLTHWDRAAYICVSKLTFIDSDNGLAPGRHQAVIRTNTTLLLIRPVGANFRDILIEI